MFVSPLLHVVKAADYLETLLPVRQFKWLHIPEVRNVTVELRASVYVCRRQSTRQDTG